MTALWLGCGCLGCFGAIAAFVVVCACVLSGRYSEQEEARMFCPNCGYEQLCPGPSFKDKIPEGKQPWINHNDGRALECAKCGLLMGLDWWASIDMEMYESLESQKEPAHD